MARTNEFSALVEHHAGQIANAWAALVFQEARYRPGSDWLDILHISTHQGIAALIDWWKEGSVSALETYLTQLCSACLRSGFSSMEVNDALLLLKDAIGVVLREHITGDAAAIWAAVSECDRQIRWMIGFFNQVYAAQMNRHLRAQYDHIAAMLKLVETTSESIDLDDVLRQVANGIIAVTDVDHCDFYLYDENNKRLIPKAGVHKTPFPEIGLDPLLHYSLDAQSDLFYQELLTRKTPLVSYDAPSDPRANQTLIALIGTKSILAVPLVANDRVIAIAVTGTFQTYRAFTDEQIQLAWDIARAAALVIEYERMRKQTQQMAALQERERLAREIHDNLAQGLTILKLQASNIQDLLRAGETDKASEFLAAMVRTASEVHTDAREAIVSLRNNAASASDFQPTVRAFLEKFQNMHGIKTELIIEADPACVLSLDVVLQLTRIIQEGVTNVRKHAQARQVTVTLKEERERLCVRIEDDGRGFDTAAVLNGRGVGLQIMRERAESLNGEFRLESAPGRGTRIEVCIPLVENRNP